MVKKRKLVSVQASYTDYIAHVLQFDRRCRQVLNLHFGLKEDIAHLQ